MKKSISLLVFSMSLTVFLSFTIHSSSMAEGRTASINLWPLLQYSSDPVERTKEVRGAGPFFVWKQDARQTQWGLRPFIYWTEDGVEPFQRLEYLYPFGKYQVTKGEKKGYLSPIALYRDEERDGKRKWDFQFFPLFGGETQNGENYGGIFPLFGTLLERYGRKEIRFYLWPLYSQSVSEGFSTTNLVWPFFSFTEGEKREGYRVWPVYGRGEEFGVSKSEFFLWPIFFKQTQGLDGDHPVEERMIFPIYVSRQSNRFEKETYLWPFLSHARDRLTDFEQWDLPYPIFRYQTGKEIKGLRIFPLYGYEEREGGTRRLFILYPLYDLKEHPMGAGRERTTRILLLSRIREGEDDQGKESEQSLRIWPFFDYEAREADSLEFSFLYLFPYKDDAFERNLFPLFRVLHWKRDSKGRSSTDLLWGLYKGTKKEGEESWEIAHLIHWTKEGKRKTVSFLHGLFRYSSDEHGATFRFLFFPFPMVGTDEKKADE